MAFFLKKGERQISIRIQKGTEYFEIASILDPNLMRRAFTNLATFILSLIIFLPAKESMAQYYGANTRVNGIWALGIRAGNGWIEGDVTPQLPNFDVGIYGQKFLNPQLDVRFSINAGEYSGQDFTPTRGFLSNPVLNGFDGSDLKYGENAVFFQNYQMQWIDAGFQLKLNFNRLFSEYGHDDWDAFLLLGVGMLASQTYMDAFGQSEPTVYDYSILLDNLDEREQVLQALEKIQDGIYESRAETDYINSTLIRGMVINPQVLSGFGLRCRISKSMFMGFLAEYNFVGSDLLDGQQWQELGEGIQASPGNDRLLRLGLSIDWELN